jgi:hypothetical protein
MAPLNRRRGEAVIPTLENIIESIMADRVGESLAMRRADLLAKVERELNHNGQPKLSDQFKDADRVLRDAYVKMNRYCSCAHGLFIPTGAGDVDKFEAYLKPKVPVWAVRERIDGLKARYPHFWAAKPEQMNLPMEVRA